MDLGFRLNLENPKKNVGIFSRLFFGWVIPLIKRGVNEGLKLENLYKVLKKDKSRNLTDKLEELWDNEVRKSQEKNRKPSLINALCKQFYSEIVLYGVVWFYSNVIVICLRPIILAQLIKLFSDKDVSKNYLMYVYSVALILTSLVSTMSIHHMNFAMQAIGMRVRVATSSLVYRKITRLNHKSLGETPAGKVVNILSNDLSRFDLAIPVIHAIWVMPFQVVVIFLIIWQQVGIAAVSGIATMVLLTVPVQGFLAKYVGKLRTSVSKKTDSRVKLMSEIVSGIQVIKMYAWEKPFEKLVEYTRAAEMKDISSASFVRGLYASTMIFSDKLSLFTTLITYVLLGNTISADRVFSMAQSFGILQLAMAVVYPLAVSIGAEALISIRRLEEFLSLEEKDEEDIIHGPRNTGVTISYVDASWTDMGCTLEDINIRIRPGTLCAIVGPVGSGKSSLLQLLTGELPTLCGGIEIGGEISYSAQQPWLFQSSVRNNIIFGNHYDKNLYKRVVKVCALESDFEQFPHGDRTIVGEKGVSLSGGQRARINLARAVYRKADIYLLDDPLSAVDIHVGKHLFNECIYEFLRGKTRILVTHQLQYLKKADLIIVLNDGIVEAQGTFEELSNCNLDFTKILVAADETEENINEDADADLVNSDTEECRKFSITSSTKMSLMSVSSSDVSEKGDNQIVEEKSGDGPNSKPFKNYLASVKYNSLVVLVIFLLISSQALIVGIDQWLTLWTSQEQIRHSNSTIIIQIHLDLLNNTNGYNNSSLDSSNHVKYFKNLNDSTNSLLFNKYNGEVKNNYSDNSVNNIVADFVKNHDEHTTNREYNFFDKNNHSINTNNSFYNKYDKRIKKRQSSFVNKSEIANNNYGFMNNFNDKSADNTDRYNKPDNVNKDQEFFENKNNSDKNHDDIFNRLDSVEKEHSFFENKNYSDKNNDNNFNKRNNINNDQEFFENKNISDKKYEDIFNRPNSNEKEQGFFDNKNNSDKNSDNIFNKRGNIKKDKEFIENKNNRDNNSDNIFNKRDNIDQKFFENKNNGDENSNSVFNKRDNINKHQEFFENKNIGDKNHDDNFNRPDSIEKDHGFFENKNNSDKNNDNNFNKRGNINKDQEFIENKSNRDKNSDNIFNKLDNINKGQEFFENKNNSDKNNYNMIDDINKDHDVFETKNNSDKNDGNIINKLDNINKYQKNFGNKNNSNKNNDNMFNKFDNINKDHDVFETKNNSDKNDGNIINNLDNINNYQKNFGNKNSSDKNNNNMFNKFDNINKDHDVFENKNNGDKNSDNIFNKRGNINKDQEFIENKNNRDKNSDNIFNKLDNINKDQELFENKNNSDKNNYNMIDNINKDHDDDVFEIKNNSDKNNGNIINKLDNINKYQENFGNKNNSDKNNDNMFNKFDNINKDHDFFETKNSDKNDGNIINNLDNINRENELFKTKNNSDKSNDNIYYKPENINKEFFGSQNDRATTNFDSLNNIHNITNNEHYFFDHHNFSFDTKNIHNISIDNSTMNAWNRIIRKLHVHDIMSYVTLNVNNMFDYVIADGTLQRLYKTETAMYIYGTMIILVILLVLSRTFLFFTSSVMASENLHSMMFNKLLKAPMRFFDTNPSGRILNRFSKDVGCIDEILPRVLLDSISIFLVMAGILVNIAITSPIMIIALIILGALYLKFRSWYMVTAKTLKHLEGISLSWRIPLVAVVTETVLLLLNPLINATLLISAKSPVFSHVSSTLCGIVTIRASHSEDILIDEFDRHQDVHTSAWYLTLACMNAFGIWLDLIVLVFLAIVTFSFVISASVTNVNGSSVGLAVSQCMVLTGMLQYGMKQLAEVINNLTSVERILQYTTIENEGPFETPKEKRPKGTWPTVGNIEFKKLYLKYIQNEPPVLKNLNVVFKPGEKIGIVGRTGAGKSSLISALFRLAPLEGSVLIDRVDINNLGLTDLRKKISIIPQEPVLFSETLRYNLDPFNEFDDDEIWDTLELVEMKESVDSLDFLVAEGGNNFSLGQKQLICLARAILKENKILILDEATANVDHKTDALIQATIRKIFKDCTVLTIAHRLNTIMDSDKVLVMSFGNVVEFDHPHNLLLIEDGYFHKMVLETSPNMAQELKNIAQNAYLKQMEEKDD